MWLRPLKRETSNKMAFQPTTSGGIISPIYGNGRQKQNTPKGKGYIPSKKPSEFTIGSLGLALKELFVWTVLEGMKPKEKITLTSNDDIAMYMRQVYEYTKYTRKFNPNAQSVFYIMPHRFELDPSERYTVKMGNRRVKSVPRVGEIKSVDIYRL